MAGVGDGGPPYWTVAGIVRAAETNWEFIDATSPTDLMALPLDRFCNYVLTFMRTHQKPDDYLLWREAIERPPPGVEAETGAWSDQEMMRQFQTFRTP